jgi:hypothetical protein
MTRDQYIATLNRVVSFLQTAALLANDLPAPGVLLEARALVEQPVDAELAGLCAESWSLEKQRRMLELVAGMQAQLEVICRQETPERTHGEIHDRQVEARHK